MTYGKVISGSGNTNLFGPSIFIQTNTTAFKTIYTNYSTTGDGVVVTGGIFVFTGNNTNNGTLNVNGGALVVNGKVASVVNVNNSEYLGGHGNINADVNDNGITAPGINETMSYANLGSTGRTIGTASAFDTLTITGNLIWNPDNTINIFHLNSANSTAISDRVNVVGNITYAGSGTNPIDFDFQDTGFFDGTHPTTYTLMTATQGINLGQLALSDFQALNVWAGGAGSNFGQSRFIIVNTGGLSQALEFVVVPEPSTWGLLAGGAMLLLGLRRKRLLAKAAKAGVNTQA